MRLYPSITVDLYKPYPLVVLDVPQNNIGRGAMVTLTAGGAVVIPENETVEVYAKKPDGTKVYNTVIVAGNQLQVAFSPQMTAVEGILQVELQMIDSTGNSITTPIFVVRILKSNIDANAIISQDDFQALVDALAEVEEIKSTIQKGDPGEAATIQVGTVTASDPGSNPQVNNSGTEQDAVFDFVLPRGDPGSMWYQGDAITGTSTSGTVFTGSGIENAKLNDMYLNIGIGADRGNVYVCTLAGNASTAQWAYKQNIMGPTGPAGTANASSVAYNNETSGLTADNVQEAVDELNQNMTRTSNAVTSGYTVTNYDTYKENGIQHIKAVISATVSPSAAEDGYFTIGFAPEVPLQTEMFSGIYLYNSHIYPVILRVTANKNIGIYISDEITSLGNSSGNVFIETSYSI